MLVAFPPTPFSTPSLLPACSAFRMLFGRILPFQSVRLSSPISRMFCAPMDGPLRIAWETRQCCLDVVHDKIRKAADREDQGRGHAAQGIPGLSGGAPQRSRRAWPHHGIFSRSPSPGFLPSVEAYLHGSCDQCATANIRSTYEQPTMARSTPEQAVRRRARSQAARRSRAPAGRGADADGRPRTPTARTRTPTACLGTPSRDSGWGDRDARGSDPRGRDPGRGGRDSDPRGPRGDGRDQGPSAGRGGDLGTGAQTRRRPA